MATIQIEELRRLLILALIKLGYVQSKAEIVADVLLYAELRGNNQGIIKLVTSALNLESTVDRAVEIIHETPISARLDGNRNIGIVVVHAAVSKAIEKCRTSGMAIIGCSNYASATGALGYWPRMLASEGFISIVMSQCSEMVAPDGSYEPIFGTNPLAIGVPTTPRPQILDMATSACAYYGIKIAEKNGEKIPGDVAYDCEGNETTDPSAALRGAIRSFDRSYKGSHLALMVELLAGAFTGAAMSDKISAKNWGTLIIAIDPNIMGNREEFIEQAKIMCSRVKEAKRLPSHEGKEIYLPGERGDALEKDRLAKGTIEIHNELLSELHRLTV